MDLSELKVGRHAVVRTVGGEGALRQHFLDMGLIPGSELTLVQYAPMGDPIEVRIHGYELTLRLDEARQIEITPDEEADDASAADMRRGISRLPEEGKNADAGWTSTSKRHSMRQQQEQDLQRYMTKIEHPGLGEPGRYHDKEDEHPYPDDKVLTFALAGNQNCGKTTLFNQLTGSNQHVGNFPGVTVDRKSGQIRGHANTEVTDLPGIYSLSPYSSEELVTRQYILDEKPAGIINIVDATNIERNLYLTMQLMELGIPMVLALNMMDEVIGNGGSIHINEMEAMLGIPVVPISAAKNAGVDELVRHAMHVAHYQEKPKRMDFCEENDNGGAVHRCLHSTMHLIEDHAKAAGIPIRFAATKIVEGDERILKALHLDQNEKETVTHIVRQMEEERGLDRAAAIADMRFTFIKKLVDTTVIKPHESREHSRSRRLDRFLTGKYSGIPAFVAIMALVFWLTFNVIGARLQVLLQTGIDALTVVVDHALTAVHLNPAIHSLVIDGVFQGVGSVLSFMPIIVVMFFFLSLLEDTGYMARVAFIMDKLLRKIGLSGRSIVPMLIGFGCSVPSVMASRTLPSERDRKMTIMLTPFMSCSAKLPIYGFLTAAFFPGHGALIMISLYLLGIALAVVVALISKNSVFKGEAVPFVMELPNYRLPGAKNVGRLLWDKSKDFLQRAFSVIFIATIVVWFLQTFSVNLSMVTSSQDSILAMIAGWITPIFKPMGFADWRITTSLITGFMAKESVVSTLGLLFGSTKALVATITPLSALALLVFCLLYTPCVAAVASIRRELGGKWAAWVVVGQCVIAWCVSFLVFMIGRLFGFG